MMRRASDPTKRIEKLLEAQRKALLAGDLAALPKMTSDLGRIMATLKAETLSPPDLAHVKTLAARNAQLLAAAHRGLAQTRERLRPSAPSDLTTYGAQGHRQSTVGLQGRLLSRR